MMMRAEGVAAHRINADPTREVLVAVLSNHSEDVPVAVPEPGTTLESVARYYLDMGVRVVVDAGSDIESLRLARILSCSALVGGEQVCLSEMSALDYALARYSCADRKDEHRARVAAAFRLAGRVPTDLDEEDAAQLLADHAPRRGISFEDHLSAVDYATNKHKSRVKSLCTVAGDVGRESVNELDRSVVDRILAKPGVTLLKTPTGSGKSSKVVEPLFVEAARQGLHPHLISPLISIARGQKERLERKLGTDLTYYSDIRPGDAARSAGMVSVINSSTKSPVREISRKAEVLVLEEGEKILQSVADSKHIDDRKEVMRELEDRIRQASHVVIADADISDVTLDFVKTIREDVRLVEMTADHRDVEVEIYDKGKLFSDSKKLYQSGSSLIAFSDSKRLLRELIKAVDAEGQPDTLHITADNRGLDAQNAFANDPDREVKKYRMLAYTPALASSVSITKDCFDEVIGFATGVLSALEFIQMMRRYRPAKKVKIAICAKPEIQRPRDLKCEAEQAFGELDLYDRLFAKIKSRKLYSKGSIYTSLPITLREQKFIVTRRKSDNHTSNRGHSLIANAKKLDELQYIEGVIKARDIDSCEARKLKKSDRKTIGDIWALHRYDIVKNIGHVSEESVKWWGQGVGRSKLELLKILSMSESDAREMKGSDNRAKVDRFDYVAARSLIGGVFSILGIDLIGGGRYTRGDAVRAVKFLQENAAAWNGLGVTRFVDPHIDADTGRFATLVISDMLRSMGVSKKKSRTRRNGCQVTTFKILNAEQLRGYLSFGGKMEAA